MRRPDCGWILRLVVGLGVPVVALLAVRLWEDGPLLDARARSFASFYPGYSLALVGENTIVAGGVLAAAAAARWSRSLLVDAAYVLAGAFVAGNYFLVIWLGSSVSGSPPLAPDPLARFITDAFAYTQTYGDAPAVPILGAGTFLVGLWALLAATAHRLLRLARPPASPTGMATASSAAADGPVVVGAVTTADGSTSQPGPVVLEALTRTTVGRVDARGRVLVFVVLLAAATLVGAAVVKPWGARPGASAAPTLPSERAPYAWQLGSGVDPVTTRNSTSGESGGPIPFGPITWRGPQVYNDASEPAVIDSADVIGPPGAKVVASALVRVGGTGNTGLGAVPPANGSIPSHRIVGSVIQPATLSGWEHGAWIEVVVKVPAPGWISLQGILLRYHIGSAHFETVEPGMWEACLGPDASGQCAPSSS